MSRALLASAIGLLICLSLPAQTSAQGSSAEDEARAHFLLGRAHHDKGEFAAAAAQFERAYAISQKPALLYNLFVAYRDANDNPRAADALRRYLADEKQVENRKQLEAKLAAMESAIAAEQQAAAAAAAAAAAQAQDPAPATQEPQGDEPAEPSHAEPAATQPDEPPQEDSGGLPVGPIIVIGVGGAMVIGSLVTGAMASGKQSDLEKECPDRSSCGESLEDTKSAGETLALVTDVLLFGGIATAGAGVLWWLLDDGGQESSAARRVGHPRASLYCGPAACGGSVRGAF